MGKETFLCNSKTTHTSVFKVYMPLLEVLEQHNRNLGYASISIIVSFCHFLLRHLYLEDAGMRCLTFLENGPFANIFCLLVQGDC